MPELAVLPDHDWAAVEAAKTKDMVLHPFSTNEVAEDSGKEKSEKQPKKEDKKQQKRAAQKKKADQQKPH